MRLIIKASALIPVKKVVHRKGKTHVQTYHVRPPEEKLVSGLGISEFKLPPPPTYPATAGGRTRQKLDEIAKSFEHKFTALFEEIEGLRQRVDSDPSGKVIEQLGRAEYRLEALKAYYSEQLMDALAAEDGPVLGHPFFDKRNLGETEIPPFPEDQRNRTLKGFEFVCDLVSPKALEYFSVSIRPRTPEESPHQREGAIYVTPEDFPSTVAHELGHVLHDLIPGANERILEWYHRRTADSSPTWITTESWPGYQANPDHFFHPYVGRIYTRRVNGVIHEFLGREVLSMGIEALYENPVAFARKDPDHFDLVISLLRGEGS